MSSVSIHLWLFLNIFLGCSGISTNVCEFDQPSARSNISGIDDDLWSQIWKTGMNSVKESGMCVEIILACDDEPGYGLMPLPNTVTRSTQSMSLSSSTSTVMSLSIEQSVMSSASGITTPSSTRTISSVFSSLSRPTTEVLRSSTATSDIGIYAVGAAFEESLMPTRPPTSAKASTPSSETMSSISAADSLVASSSESSRLSTTIQGRSLSTSTQSSNVYLSTISPESSNASSQTPSSLLLSSSIITSNSMPTTSTLTSLDQAPSTTIIDNNTSMTAPSSIDSTTSVSSSTVREDFSNTSMPISVDSFSSIETISGSFTSTTLTSSTSSSIDRPSSVPITSDAPTPAKSSSSTSSDIESTTSQSPTPSPTCPSSTIFASNNQPYELNCDVGTTFTFDGVLIKEAKVADQSSCLDSCESSDEQCIALQYEPSTKTCKLFSTIYVYRYGILGINSATKKCPIRQYVTKRNIRYPGQFYDLPNLVEIQSLADCEEYCSCESRCRTATWDRVGKFCLASAQVSGDWYEDENFDTSVRALIGDSGPLISTTASKISAASLTAMSTISSSDSSSTSIAVISTETMTTTIPSSVSSAESSASMIVSTSTGVSTMVLSTITSHKEPSATTTVKSCQDVVPEYDAQNDAVFDIKCKDQIGFEDTVSSQLLGLCFTDCLEACSSTLNCDAASYTTYQDANDQPVCNLLKFGINANSFGAFDFGVLRSGTVSTNTTSTSSTQISTTTTTATARTLTTAVSTPTSSNQPSATTLLKACIDIEPEYNAVNGDVFDITCKDRFRFESRTGPPLFGISFTECLEACSGISDCDAAAYTPDQATPSKGACNPVKLGLPRNTYDGVDFGVRKSGTAFTTTTSTSSSDISTTATTRITETLTTIVSTTTSDSTPSATIVIKSCVEVAPEYAAPNGANFDIQCSRSYVYFLQNLGLTSGISFIEYLNLCSETSDCDIAIYTTYSNFEPDCVLVRTARDGNNIQTFANVDAGILKPRATTITTTTTTPASTFSTQITTTATPTTSTATSCDGDTCDSSNPCCNGAECMPMPSAASTCMMTAASATMAAARPTCVPGYKFATDGIPYTIECGVSYDPVAPIVRAADKIEQCIELCEQTAPCNYINYDNRVLGVNRCQLLTQQDNGSITSGEGYIRAYRTCQYWGDYRDQQQPVFCCPACN